MTQLTTIRPHYLYPSNLFIGTDGEWVTTVLGSCISVCLFDQKLKIGGINHYMLPLWNGDGLATAKYGNIAIEKLVNEMEQRNSLRTNMVAKIFGGANQANFTARIGDRNVEMAREVLANLRIPIVAESVGGIKGRKIIFETTTGLVKMKLIQSNAINQTR